MPTLRTVYTREELLRIAALANGIEVSPGIISKFNVIEVAEPAAIPRRRETDLAPPGASNDNGTNIIGSGLPSNNSAAKTNTSGNANAPSNGSSSSTAINNNNSNNNSSNGGLSHSNAGAAPTYNTRNNADGRRGGNSNNGRDDTNNSNNRRSNDDRRQGGYDRFAPLEGCFSRGSRNQETFEFGVEYELQHSAMQKRRVTETMEREDRKGEQLKQALDKFKQEGKPTQSKEAEMKETDEIERLLAGIAISDDAQPKAARSRFFSAQAPVSPAPPVSTATPAQQPLQQSQQQQQLSAPSAANNNAGGNSNTASMTAPVTGGVAPMNTAAQPKVLITPSNSGTPGYAASPWGNVKNEMKLWTTAPSMASALKQSLQQQSGSSSPSSSSQNKPVSPPQSKPASQLPYPQPPQQVPTPPVSNTPPAIASNANVSPLPTAQGQVLGAASMNFSTAPKASPAFPGGVGNPIAAMGVKASVLGPGSQQHSRPTSASPAAVAGANPPAPSRAWTAAELEQLLKSGKAVPTAAPLPPPHPAASSAQPGAAKVFAVADLESMLMQQARQGTGLNLNTVQPAMPQHPQPSQSHLHTPPQVPLQHQQPQQQQTAPPQFMTAVKTPTMMPQNPCGSVGSFPCAVPRSPPQQFPTGMKMPPSPPMLPVQQPPPQQHQQQLPPPPPPMNGQQPWIAMPQPQQQQQQHQGLPLHSSSVPHGVRASPPQQPQQASKMPPPPQIPPQQMAMPIMVNAQGQYFAAPPPQQPFFLPGQPVMFRRPDGTVFMQPQPQPQQQAQQLQFNPFGTNAQYLFQQQQQQRR